MHQGNNVVNHERIDAIARLLDAVRLLPAASVNVLAQLAESAAWSHHAALEAANSAEEVAFGVVVGDRQ